MPPIAVHRLIAEGNAVTVEEQTAEQIEIHDLPPSPIPHGPTHEIRSVRHRRAVQELSVEQSSQPVVSGEDLRSRRPHCRLHPVGQRPARPTERIDHLGPRRHARGRRMPRVRGRHSIQVSGRQLVVGVEHSRIRGTRCRRQFEAPVEGSSNAERLRRSFVTDSQVTTCAHHLLAGESVLFEWRIGRRVIDDDGPPTRVRLCDQAPQRAPQMIDTMVVGHEHDVAFLTRRGRTQHGRDAIGGKGRHPRIP